MEEMFKKTQTERLSVYRSRTMAELAYARNTDPRMCQEELRTTRTLGSRISLHIGVSPIPRTKSIRNPEQRTTAVHHDRVMTTG